ncbi:MAG: FecR domain-containing protein [Candidatus Cloacimonetes bacterium]|nr:FecR domain-containing protein [Candidatus Cloacimonadota bacterium]
MNCDEFEKLLNDEIDNILSLDAKPSVEKHSEECRSCKNTQDWYSRIKSILVSDEELDVPAGFTNSVMSQINALPAYDAPQQLTPFYVKVGFALAASVAGLAFIMGSSDVDPSKSLIRPQIEMAANNLASETMIAKADLDLVAVQGEVQIFKEDSLMWQNVSEEIALSFSDKIRTLSDSSVHLKYVDGTELKLKENSQIQVMDHGIRVFHGDSWIKVVKKGRHFEARTPNLVASVRGTIYDVSVQYKQEPYADFLQRVTQKNLFSGISPEVYFREFSLGALNEIGEETFSNVVESSVKVYESKVWVGSIDEASNGQIVSEGHNLVANASTENFKNLTQSNISAKDYSSWTMTVPDFIEETKSPKVVETEASEATQVPVQEAPTTSGVELNDSKEVNPLDSFNTINKD